MSKLLSIKLFSQIISLICYCFPLKDLCSHSVVQEDETLKKTCYLTQGALMHEYCKDKDADCLNDKALVCISSLINTLPHSVVAIHVADHIAYNNISIIQ